MKYKVHRWDMVKENRQGQLEQFLNQMEGDIAAIIPNFRKTSLAQFYGVAGKVDFLLIVEKTKS
jgi:hypothetical protein